MTCTLLDATPRPLILVLDYKQKPRGGLTFRQLHRQVRERLGLEPKVSLRMCPFRPWHRHIKSSFPIPEAYAIPASDAQCTHLLGTTLLYYTYVHLHDTASTPPHSPLAGWQPMGMGDFRYHPAALGVHEENVLGNPFYGPWPQHMSYCEVLQQMWRNYDD